MENLDQHHQISKFLAEADKMVAVLNLSLVSTPLPLSLTLGECSSTALAVFRNQRTETCAKKARKEPAFVAQVSVVFSCFFFSKKKKKKSSVSDIQKKKKTTIECLEQMEGHYDHSMYNVPAKTLFIRQLKAPSIVVSDNNRCVKLTLLSPVEL